MQKRLLYLYYYYESVSTQQTQNICTTSAQRLRRWTNIVQEHFYWVPMLIHKITYCTAFCVPFINCMCDLLRRVGSYIHQMSLVHIRHFK